MLPGGFPGRNRDRPDLVVLSTEPDILQVRTGSDATIRVPPSRGVHDLPVREHAGAPRAFRGRVGAEDPDDDVRPCMVVVRRIVP